MSGTSHGKPFGNKDTGWGEGLWVLSDTIY